MSVLIKGGRIITAADDYVGDVFVEDERISLIGESLDVDADRVIDATGKYVLPGLRRPAHAPRHAVRRHGDDRRRHVGPDRRRVRRHDLPRRLLHPDARAARSPRRSTTGTRSARASRSSTWASTSRSPTCARAARSRSSRALPDAGHHLVQALHGLQGRAHGRRRDALPDDGGRRRDRRARDGARRERRRDRRPRQAGARGRATRRRTTTRCTRPPETEGEATNRAIQLARVAGAPLYVVHVSCKESVEPIARAREQGWDVWGETCTQYFFIDYTYLERPDFEGAKYVYTPPPRAEGEPGGPLARGALGHPLGDLDRPLRVPLGRAEVDRPDDFSKIPNGGPGLENRLHMIHEFGVRDGPHLAEPDGRAALDEPGEALRPLPAEGHDRAGLGRGHRDLRPREAAPDHGRDPALEDRTTTSTRAPR